MTEDRLLKFDQSEGIENGEQALETEKTAPVVEATPKEKGLASLIKGAQDFDELFQVIADSEGIDGSEWFYTPADLITRIEGVINGSRELKSITNTCGLRQKVGELLDMKHIREELKDKAA